MCGKVAVIVATISFGMGVDKGSVRLVLCFNNCKIPKRLKLLYHVMYNIFLGLWFTGVLLKMQPDITKSPEELAVMDFQPNVEFIIPDKNEKL